MADERDELIEITAELLGETPETLEERARRMCRMTERLRSEGLDTVMQIFCAAVAALLEKGIRPHSLKAGIQLTTLTMPAPSPPPKTNMDEYTSAVEAALHDIDIRSLPNRRALATAVALVGLAELHILHEMPKEMAHHLVDDVWAAECVKSRPH